MLGRPHVRFVLGAAWADPCACLNPMSHKEAGSNDRKTRLTMRRIRMRLDDERSVLSIA